MAWAGNAHRTIYERKLVILRLYLSNFTSEHTAELGLGQGIRMLGWLGTKVSFMEIKAKVRYQPNIHDTNPLCTTFKRRATSEWRVVIARNREWAAQQQEPNVY